MLLLAIMPLCLNAQIFPAFGNSRTGTTGMQFLKIAPDARSAGMGGAFHAVVNDASSLYWNPAGIAHSDTQRFQVQFSRANYFAGTGMHYGALVYRPSPQHFWGFQVLNLRTKEMPVTTEWQPFGTGQTYFVSDLVLGITYGRILSEKFSFGITTKYAYEGIATVKVHNILFDLGLQYHIGWKDVRFSVGFSNFGFNVEPTGRVNILTLDGEKAINNFDAITVPAIFRVGVAKEFINTDWHRLTVSAQLNHPTDNNETFAIGGEYGYKNYLFARTGYEVGVDEGGWPALGMGIRLPRNFGGLRFDYAYNHKRLLGASHRISLGISLK